MGWGNIRGLYQNAAGDQLWLPDSSDLAEHREFWSSDHNQRELLRDGVYPSDHFSLIMDIKIGDEVWETLYADSERHVNRSYTPDEWFALVCDNISKLKWCYIPLTDEWYYAILIASPQYAWLVDTVARTLDGIQKEVFTVGNCPKLAKMQFGRKS